jgi:gluconolactonase
VVRRLVLVLLAACGGGGPGAGAGVDAPAADAGVEASVPADADGQASWRCPAGPFANPLAAGAPTPVPISGVPPDDGVLSGWAILEGPVWQDGVLYLTHWNNQGARILKLDPLAGVSVLLAAAGANGLAVDGSGDLVGACHGDGSIRRFPRLAPEQRLLIADRYQGAPFDGPNDLAIRRDGTIYFSDVDSQRLFRVTPGGVVDLVDDGLQQPNGVTLSADDRTLYVAEYHAGADRNIYRYPVADDGALGVRARFSPGGGDGMVVDCAGNLYVARGREVVVIDGAGMILGAIAVDAGEGVTNLAFGGADRKTLYITGLGSPPRLQAVTLPTPGLPY